MATCGKCKTVGVTVAHVRGCYGGAVDPSAELLQPAYAGSAKTLSQRLLDISSPNVGSRLIDRASKVYDDHLEDPEPQIMAEAALESLDFAKLEAEMDEMVQANEIKQEQAAYEAKMARDEMLATPTRDELIAATKRTPVTETGIYRLKDSIYSVVRTRDGQRMYAKVLTNFEGKLPTPDQVASFQFDYAPGAIARLAAQDKLSDEEAALFTQRRAVREPIDFKAVPASQYALEGENGVEFFLVEVGKGRWDGVTFVKRLYGAPGAWRKERTTRDQAAAIIARITRDHFADEVGNEYDGAPAAALRFSRKFNVCSRCSSPLSDPQSRASGFGQHCAGKVGATYHKLPVALQMLGEG